MSDRKKVSTGLFSWPLARLAVALCLMITLISARQASAASEQLQTKQEQERFSNKLSNVTFLKLNGHHSPTLSAPQNQSHLQPAQTKPKNMSQQDRANNGQILSTFVPVSMNSKQTSYLVQYPSSNTNTNAHKSESFQKRSDGANNQPTEFKEAFRAEKLKSSLRPSEASFSSGGARPKDNYKKITSAALNTTTTTLVKKKKDLKMVKVSQKYTLAEKADRRPAEEPKTSTTVKPTEASTTSTSTGGLLIDRAATSHMVSFAEPLASATTTSNIRPRQQPSRMPQALPDQSELLPQTKPIPASEEGKERQKLTRRADRWTHFGARLKPLAPVFGTGGPADHAESASNARGLAYYRAAAGPSTSNGWQRAGNQPANSADPEEELEDGSDGQDSEALLYKMMQQQNYLLSPESLADQAEGSGNELAAGAPEAGALSGSPGAHGSGAQERPAGANGRHKQEAQSKRVMKLLKSYSHIHQVDDSDDQIRGTYTRPHAAARRHQHQQQHHQQQQHQQHQLHRQTGAGSWQAKEAPARRQQKPPSQEARRQKQQEHSDREQSESDNDDGSYSENDVAAPANQAHGGRQEVSEPAPASAEQEEEFECPNNGIFADEPSGCQYYHVCQSGAQVQQKFQCPMGTLFNNLILTCDFAHNVQCGKRPAAGRSSTPDGAEEPRQSATAAAAYGNARRSSSPAAPSPAARASQYRHTAASSALGQPDSGPREQRTGAAAAAARRRQQAAREEEAAAAGEPEGDADDSSSPDDSAAEEGPAPAPRRSQLQQQPQPQPHPHPQQQRAAQTHRRQSAGQWQPRPAKPVRPAKADRYANINSQVQYDGASVASLVFANGHPEAAGAHADDEANSLNLVINHMVPTGGHAARAQQLLQGVANSQQQMARQQASFNRSHQKALQVRQHQQHQSQLAGQSQRKAAASGYAGQPRGEQQVRRLISGAPQQLEARQARELASVTQPTMISMTNSANVGGQQRASPDAGSSLNDGLVLLVQHGGGGGGGLASGGKPARSPAVMSKGLASGSPPAASSGGEAYALDSRALRAGSEAGAQLFPNVHRALLAAEAGLARPPLGLMPGVGLPGFEAGSMPSLGQLVAMSPPVQFIAVSSSPAPVTALPGALHNQEQKPANLISHLRVRRAKKVQRGGAVAAAAARPLPAVSTDRQVSKES